jgi:hypothetical protein
MISAADQSGRQRQHRRKEKAEAPYAKASAHLRGFISPDQD